MFEVVDLYCERLGPQFWAEPVNAFTNASFLIAAWFSWLHAKRLDALSSSVWLLLTLMCAIGFGSASFHTVANNLTRYLDVLPIMLFQLIFVWLYCRRIMGIRQLPAIIIVMGYLVAAIVGRQFPDVLNGSLIYGPAIIVLLTLGTYHAVMLHRERFAVLGAALVFLVSLSARTLDAFVCPHFPLGTHFLWHLLNGLVLYLLFRALVANLSEGRG